jgi:antitoxin (DNA-binding transcriptional repressor) of toxin-antitoxin stability system
MDGLTLRAEDLGLTAEMQERVAQGEAVEITRGGAVVAKVVAPAPDKPRPTSPEMDIFIDRMLVNRAIRGLLRRGGAVVTAVFIPEVLHVLVKAERRPEV